jgi:hypothetical protein
MLSSASSGSLVQPCRIRGGPTRSWLPTRSMWSSEPYARAPAGSFRGFATPQGVTTAVEMVHIWRLANGKIVEHWAVRDDLALMRQLGVVKSGQAVRPRPQIEARRPRLEARSHHLGVLVADRSADAT